MTTSLVTLKAIVGNPVTWTILAALCGIVATVLTLRDQDRQVRNLEDWLTGGESYGVLEPHPHPSGGVQYFLRHVGAHPVYNVNIRIYEPPNRQLLYHHYEEILTTTHQWLFVWPVDAPTASDKEHRYRVEISPRRGNVVQYLTLTPRDGRWQTESRTVLRSDDPSQPLPVPTDFKEPRR